MGFTIVVICGSKGAGTGLEDLLFYTITQGEEKISMGHFISVSDTSIVNESMTNNDSFFFVLQVLQPNEHEVKGERIYCSYT